MLIGLLAGAIAALIAGLLSLPLHSPDDAIFNTATITVGALIAGVAAGTLQTMLSPRWFAIAWGGAFIVVVAALAASEAVFTRMIAFGLPIATVVFGVTGPGAWFLRERVTSRVPAIAGLATVVALGAGVALAGQRDSASGALALPPSTSSIAASTAAGTATSATATGAVAAGASATAATTGALPTTFTTPAELKNVTFVVGQGSQATFTVNEKLAGVPLPNDAVEKSSALSGSVHLDGRPTTVTLDLQQLSSDQSRRDTFVRQMFRAQPKAILTVPSIGALPDRYTAGQTVKQQVTGTLAINGVQRPITFDIEAQLDGTTLNVHGKTSFTWKDFDITPPNTPTVQVQDKVVVEVLLVARAQAG